MNQAPLSLWGADSVQGKTWIVVPSEIRSSLLLVRLTAEALSRPLARPKEVKARRKLALVAKLVNSLSIVLWAEVTERRTKGVRIQHVHGLEDSILLLPN